jgi:hypothetical protein
MTKKSLIGVGDSILFSKSGGSEKGKVIDTFSYPQEIGRIFDVTTDKGEEDVKEVDVIRKIKNRAV